MGIFSGVLLVSDFDDTLSSSGSAVSEGNRRALDYFVREGGRFTVATGRAHATMAPVAHLAPINAPVVLSNGSGLYDFQTDRMIYETFLPHRVAQDMAQVCAAFPSLGFESYHGDDIYAWNPNQVTWSHLRRARAVCTQCAVEKMPLPWSKAILQQEHPLLLEAQAWLLGRYGDRYEAIFSNQYYLEVTRKGSTKGGMVDRLVEHLGVDPGKLYCVGDNQNDIPMLERSAIPFAPANCAQEVKDWGARVLCHCDDGVIGDIVDILDGIY